MNLVVWLGAIRPKTLGAGAAPVIAGTALAWREGTPHWPSALAALLGALLLQIGSNLANDYYDFINGVDAHRQHGPIRATQSGLVTPAAMRLAFLLVFAASLFPGLYIVWRGGWPFVAIGLCAIAAGVLYTGGPWPLGYVGLGDLFVLVFFGPVAVCGSYYLQAGRLGVDPFIASLGPGMLAVALLTVNNLRDIDEDRLAGKRTLVARFGVVFARCEYLFCLLLAGAVAPCWFYWRTGHLASFLPMMAVVVFGAIPAKLALTQRGPVLNQALGGTGRLLLVYALAFGAG